MPDSPRRRPPGRPARIASLLAIGVAVAAATPTTARAHPTPEALAAQHADRRICLHGDPDRDVDDLPLDGVRLGMPTSALEARVDGLRREPGPPRREGTRPGNGDDGTEGETAAADDALERWVGPGAGDVASVEIEAWRGRVYRIRWQLGAAFERPILDDLAARATGCLGPPDLDQTFEAEPGSVDATLRRVVWTHAEQRIELRQLHPLRGGPISLSVHDPDALREIGAEGRLPSPAPHRSEPWWKRSTAPPEPVDDAERERLGRRFLHLLAHIRPG